ncbi:Ger(x)C family spore germination protein [Proteinivorax hydrogeniformans]|uniref:Ger(X)C family spore germination protein n=1 Tax=Proteinivorax hydrogeniformans TaxID=1826727 RepID=A0AAU8HW34_9FIRM
MTKMLTNSLTKKLRRIAAFLLIIAITIPSSGCWSRRELEDLAFVLAMGVEENDNGIKILAHIGQEGGGDMEDEEGEGALVIEGEGKTISDAFDNLFSKTNKRPYLNHLKVIVLSEELAREGIEPIMDFFRRDIRVRGNTTVMIAKEDSLEEVLEFEPELGTQPALLLEETFRYNWERSRAYKKDFFEVVTDILEEDRELFLPMVDVSEEEQLIISDTAVFRGYEMVEVLNNKQNLGLMYLRQQVRHGTLTLEVDEEEFVSLTILGTDVEITPVEVEGQLTFQIEIDQTLSITESHTEMDIDELEDLASRFIQLTVLDTINIAKKAETDFLGFGTLYRRTNRQQWSAQKWQEQFPQIEVIIDVETNIESTGQITA